MIRLILVLCLAVSASLAQLDTGSIGGTVSDPSGAQVPDVKVVLINERTGAVRTAQSNHQGNFIFPLIPSGQYSLKCEHAGFKTVERTGIYLQVNQQLSIPLTLEVGQVTEQVTVSETAQLVETTSGAIRETVDRQRISELPLNGRNVLQLQSLLPGAISTGSLDQGANTPGYAVNGGIGASNNYSLDGGRYQDAYFNAPMPFPNPDAIQEFSVQSSSYSAEFGRNRGASINAVTKSGSNEFHGGLFEFIRNDIFDARPFFARTAPAFKRNQYGASLGGPVKRNKLFFFFAWQGTKERGTTNTSTSTVLTPKMRAGDFSEITRRIRDPLSGSLFPDNVIPQSRLDRTAVNFAQRFVPLPNSGPFNYVTPLDRPQDTNEYVTRIDYELGQNDRVYGRYIFNQDKSFNPAGNFAGWGINQTFRRQSAVLNETHTFGPTALNSLTVTFNRVKSFIIQSPIFAWEELGARFPPASPQVFGRHGIAVTGYFTAANGTFWDLARNDFNYDDTFSWTRGRHSLKFGAQVSRYQVNQLNEFLSRGSPNFNGFATGDSAADFMMGRISSMRIASNLSNTLRQTLWHFFAADDVKVSQRLTLNLGVRWEPNLHFRERDGKQSSFRPGEQSRLFPNAPPGLLFKGDPQLPPNVTRNQWSNLAPRVGFAYDLTGDGKTSLRGGYGVFFDVIRSINLNRFPLIQPHVLDITVFDVSLSDPFQGSTIFPFVPPVTEEEKRSFRFVTPAATTSFNEDFGTPFSQQWNFNVQRQLPADVVVTTAYVGSKSSRLFGSHNINPAVFGPGATVANTQNRRIYPLFGTIEDESTVGYSQYHSFQLTINKRLSRGFTVLAAYTVSKNIGLTSSQGEGSLGTRDPSNWNLDKGVMNEDRPQVMTTSFVWDIPAGFERGLGRQILGGWELTGIVSAVSGSPLTVRAGSDRSLQGQNLDTADAIGVAKLPGGRSRQEEMNSWFNKAAFALPAVGTVGTAGINTVRGPGSYTIDAGLYRNFNVTERFRIQFRGEFFNLFNHTRLGNPNTAFNNANFGRILATGVPRVGELALKFQF